MRRVNNISDSFVDRHVQCVLAEGYSLLVGASPPRIENRLKITELEINNFVFELAPSMIFDSIYVVSRERQGAVYKTLDSLSELTTEKFNEKTRAFLLR